MSEDRSLDRAEIQDGIARISHQLELLMAGPTLGGPSDDGKLIAALEVELAALRRQASDPS